MREKQTSFKLHEFSGTWREIGQQYGEECREEIKDMHAYWENALLAVMPDKTMDEIVEKSAIFAEPIKAYAPDFMDEIEGIAEGAGISVNEVLFHQGSFEMDVAGPLYIGGCTSFAASGKATKDGKTIAGQHFDWFDGAAMVMMKLKPKDGPAILGTSIAGQLLQFGINELGVAHYANVLCWPKSIVGIPAVVSAQKALLSKNVPDALRCITQCQNAIALNHLRKNVGIPAALRISVRNVQPVAPQKNILKFVIIVLKSRMSRCKPLQRDIFLSGDIAPKLMKMLKLQCFGEFTCLWWMWSKYSSNPSRRPRQSLLNSGWHRLEQNGLRKP